VIPEAAVEAAAKVLWDKEMVAAWSKFPPSFHAPFLRDARAALEAAAPHLMARAWDECTGSLVYDDGTKVDIASMRNPYR
jgi:acyl-CoA reductase-like NAD-dependent aldehyde dehydrogenase